VVGPSTVAADNTIVPQKPVIKPGSCASCASCVIESVPCTRSSAWERKKRGKGRQSIRENGELRVEFVRLGFFTDIVDHFDGPVLALRKGHLPAGSGSSICHQARRGAGRCDLHHESNGRGRACLQVAGVARSLLTIMEERERGERERLGLI